MVATIKQGKSTNATTKYTVALRNCSYPKFNIHGLLKGRWIGNQYNPMAEINRWSVVMAAHATDFHIHTPNKPSYMHTVYSPVYCSYSSYKLYS